MHWGDLQRTPASDEKAGTLMGTECEATAPEWKTQEAIYKEAISLNSEAKKLMLNRTKHIVDLFFTPNNTPY